MHYIADLIGFQLAHEYLLIHSECIRYAKYADKNGVLEMHIVLKAIKGWQRWYGWSGPSLTNKFTGLPEQS